MKKIFLLMLIFLSACIPNYEQAPKMKDYSQVPLLELPVNRVNIVSEVEAEEKLPHVENIMPLSPEKALKNWALIRVRPNYQKNDKAKFIIQKAEMIRHDAPEKSWFIYDNYKYILSYSVKVQILDKDDNILKSTLVEGFISRKLPQKASVTQRDNMFALMLSEMENQLDKQMPKEFEKNLLDL